MPLGRGDNGQENGIKTKHTEMLWKRCFSGMPLSVPGTRLGEKNKPETEVCTNPSRTEKVQRTKWLSLGGSKMSMSFRKGEP